MLQRLARDPRNLPVILGLLIVLLVAPEIPSPLARPTSGWDGRYVLLYREGAAAAVATSLATVEPQLVSRATAAVKIDAFGEIENVRVDALDGRLDPVDPRRDPWVAGVGGLFTARQGGELLAAAYVPAVRGRIAVASRIGAVLRAAGAPRGSWRLLEAEPFSLFAGPAAALAFSLAAAGRLRRRRRGTLALAAVGALAWAPGLLNGGPGMLGPCCAALFLWMPRVAAGPASRRARRPPARASTLATGGRIAAVLVVGLAAVLPGDAATYRVVRMLASLACLELLAVAPWEAVASMPRRVRRRFPPWVTVAVFATAAFATVLPPALSSLRVPLPRVVSAVAAASPEGLAAAAATRDSAPGQTLAGLADAATHARALAVQPFVPVGTPAGAAPAGFPTEEERVTVHAYRFPAGGTAVIEAPVTVLRLAPGWLERYLEGAPEGAAERLLLEQGHAVEVRHRAAWSPLVRSIPSWFLVLLLLVLPFAVPRARRPLIRLGLSGITEPASRRRTR